VKIIQPELSFARKANEDPELLMIRVERHESVAIQKSPLNHLDPLGAIPTEGINNINCKIQIH